MAALGGDLIACASVAVTAREVNPENRIGETPDPLFGSPWIYRAAFDSLEDGIAIVDQSRRILYWNYGAEKITGIPKEEATGQYWRHLYCPSPDAVDDSVPAGCPVQEAMEAGEGRDRDLFLRHQSGHAIPIRLRASPLRRDDGAIIGSVACFLDNSPMLAALELAQSIQDDAFEDPLTGIGNRRFADHMLAEAMDCVEAQSGAVSIALLDIDHFKRTNDTYGHQVGDIVLRHVAGVIKGSLRASDFVGRWGGEEYLVILRGCSGSEARQVLERCRILVGASRVWTHGFEVSVTLSAGLTSVLPGQTAEDVIRKVDELLYFSKKNGRNQISSA